MTGPKSRWKKPRSDGALGELEQQVLLAVLRLGDGAYGVAIRDTLEEQAGRGVTFGAVYATLRRLEAKALVVSRLGPAEAVRGGRAKKFFELSAEGITTLKRSWAQLHALADGFETQLESP